ncbi:SpoIIE family protein phosphatase [Desulfonatronovibrio magnus]|uniref:SpoIIE family protein phosphatase n=1 Tax=Desulfonatronovibrio magnus TaxID=698827 RepID=UPI0006982346|nr:SpoIIE family protein phosphatase [Desulfonatronovibrio magnus]
MRESIEARKIDGLESINLLFVDDEIAILDSLKRLLMREPYGKFFANSAAEGLDIIEAEDVHVVVSDVKMPVMDGMTFLKEVRRRKPQIVRMVLSGAADLDQIVDSINNGEVYRYILKPIQIVKEFRATLLQAVELYNIKQQRFQLFEELQASNTKLREWQQKMQKELGLAGALQRKVLSVAPYIDSQMEIFSAYEPHISVGGDLFDVFSLSGGKVCVIIGDVAGHGVAPAMLSMLLRVLAGETAQAMHDKGPAAVCNVIHQRFLQYVQDPEFYATLFMGFFEPDISAWRCISCGHPQAFVYPQNPDIDLNKGVYPVGLAIGPSEIADSSDEIILPVHAGMNIVLYTDGLVESHKTSPNESCPAIDLSKVISTTLESRALNPARRIMEKVQDHGCELNNDDCSVLTINHVDMKDILWSGRVELSLVYAEKIARDIHDLFLEQGWADSFAWSVRMVVHEFAVNIIDHSGLSQGQDFYLSVRLKEGLCRIVFLDKGKEWDYLSTKSLMHKNPLYSERGRGLEILSQLCRDVLIFRRSGVNHSLFTVINDDAASIVKS